MTKSAFDLIKISGKIDSFKDFSGAIDKKLSKYVYQKEDISIFSLLQMANVDSGDIYDMELEAIDKLVNNKVNADRLKAIIAATQRGDGWTNIFAFNMALEAIDCLPVDAAAIPPQTAEEIAWAMCMFSAIEGSLTMPFKTDVLLYIKACLDKDGWTIPPLLMMFQNIENLYDDNDKRIEKIKKKFSEFTIVDIINVSSIDDLGHGVDESMANYFLRCQNLAVTIKNNYDKTVADWAYITGTD